MRVPSIMRLPVPWQLSPAAKLNPHCPLAHDLLGYWPFDDPTTRDWSGYRNHGVVTGAVRAAMKHGQTLYFDGSADYVTISSPSTYHPSTPKTYCGWLRPQSKASCTFVGFSQSATTPRIELQYSTSGQPLIYMGSSNYRYFDASAWTTLINGAWHLVCFVVTGIGQTDISNAEMWLDGNQVAPGSTYSGDVPSTCTDFIIGANYGGSTYAFLGHMTDVRVYEGNIQIAKKKMLYSNPFGTACCPLFIDPLPVWFIPTALGGLSMPVAIHHLRQQKIV